MLSNIAIDIFIGLTFVFLLYSLLATIIQEIIATRFDFRAKVLEKAILRMLEDGGTATRVTYADRIFGLLHIFNLKSLMKGRKVAPWFYAHPLVKYLAEDNWYSKPSYLSAANFSKVMIDLLKGFDRPESEIILSIHDSISSGVIHQFPIDKTDKNNPAVKNILHQNSAFADLENQVEKTIQINANTAFFLKTLWRDSGADLDSFRAKLEQWFNDTMERSTGWYKKYTRIVLFIVGISLAYWFNVDAIAIQRILSTNKTAREQMVQLAINSAPHLDPDKLLKKDSGNVQSASLLDSTYKLVAADASLTSNVLGLGKPWKDTCKICKDSLGDEAFKLRFDSLLQIHQNQDSVISKATRRLINHQEQMDALLKKTSTKVIRIEIDSIRQLQQTDSAILKKYQTTRLSEYERMLKLKERCAYISKVRDGTCFLYSPYQSGGWETLFGWLITALAVTLGAPFWFDLLGKFINLRGTGTQLKTDDLGQPSAASSAGASTQQSSPQSASNSNNTDQEAVG